MIHTKITRLRIDKKSVRQKSEEFELDWEKISKYKKIKIYTYFELENSLLLLHAIRGDKRRWEYL
jgi:hypothetical protein